METIFLTKGTNDCLIFMPNDPAIVEKTAAEEVQSYLEKALSIKYPIVLEKEARGKCIYVGQTEFAKCADILGTSIENWIIAMHGGNLILSLDQLSFASSAVLEWPAGLIMCTPWANTSR